MLVCAGDQSSAPGRQKENFAVHEAEAAGGVVRRRVPARAQRLARRRRGLGTRTARSGSRTIAAAARNRAKATNEVRVW